MNFPAPPQPQDPPPFLPQRPLPPPQQSSVSPQQQLLQAQAEAQFQQQQLQQRQLQNQQQQAPISYQGLQQYHQPPSHQQLQQFSQRMNGMNGGGGGPGNGGPGGQGQGQGQMPGSLPVPAPAGHQAELNYIYGMVEELSRQLAENRRVTEDIVSGLGKVRNKAKAQGMSNNEVIESAAEAVTEQQENLESLISSLSHSLEQAEHSRDANAALLTSYANVLSLLLKQLHDYKQKHVADVSAWHKSYRGQLDEARRENSKLREQIWEMQAHAGRANEQLRLFRRKYDEDNERWDKRVEDTAGRQEVRFWKRMAMPELEEDDPYWSDDDDVIDVAEKMRLRELAVRAREEQLMGSMAEDSDGQEDEEGHEVVGIAMMGGVAMQRDAAAAAAAAAAGRPQSVVSSTGSVGE